MCAFGRRVSSTLGGGPSGSDVFQRAMLPTSTVAGRAPRGSIARCTCFNSHSYQTFGSVLYVRKLQDFL